MELKPSFT